jgi:dihydroorotase
LHHFFKFVSSNVGGGGLCQPDTNFDRYMDTTKAMYKELMTICKSSQTNEVEIISKSFKINNVEGLELYPKNPDNDSNSTILICDSIQKTITVLKHSMNKFW